MECLLYVLVETSNLELRDQVELNLSVDKPVLEEDVGGAAMAKSIFGVGISASSRASLSV
jgi:hypothetical protein